MNLTLTRYECKDIGIFGDLTDETGARVCFTLEHAYDSGLGNGSYAPKVPSGTYTCKRSQHQLAHMDFPFTTFQIMNVPNHTNILFHSGNFNADSDGCVLVGTTSYQERLFQSMAAFKKFMEIQNGVDEFTLIVK